MTTDVGITLTEFEFRVLECVRDGFDPWKAVLIKTQGAHSQALGRLEKKGLIRRASDGPTCYMLTETGREWLG